jgi:hypothetical protein
MFSGLVGFRVEEEAYQTHSLTPWYKDYCKKLLFSTPSPPPERQIHNLGGSKADSAMESNDQLLKKSQP